MTTEVDWSFRIYQPSLPKPLNDVRMRDRLELEYGHIVDDNQHHAKGVEPVESLTIRIGHIINYILMAQYVKKQAKRERVGMLCKCKLNTKSKMCLSLSEKAIVASCFRKAKQAFDGTHNKPHRWGYFYASPYGNGHWTGREARTSIFQHHLAANLHPDFYVKPKVFRNAVYRVNHPRHLTGHRPVPHLQFIDPATWRQHTKYTTEYPLVEDGWNGGGFPSALEAGSKGPARTLVSYEYDGRTRFEGVISHRGMDDPHNHYLAVYHEPWGT